MRTDEICVVRPGVDITASNIEEFKVVLDELCARRGVHVIVDLEGVGMVTTPGISALLEGAKEAREHGGNLAVARPTPRVAQVLARLRLGGVLKVTEGIEEAVQLGDGHEHLGALAAAAAAASAAHGSGAVPHA